MTTCLDPQAKLCLLRHLHAVHHGLEGKPCHGCEPAGQVTAALRDVEKRTARPAPGDNGLSALRRELTAAKAELEAMKTAKESLDSEVRAVLAAIPGASSEGDGPELVTSLALAVSSVLGINRDLMAKLSTLSAPAPAERENVAIDGDGVDHTRSNHPWVDHAAPDEVRQPAPEVPALGGIDLAALRAALLPFVQRQERTGQKSMYLDRLQDAYNAAAPKGARFTGRKKFSAAMAMVPGLAVQGSWLLLDRGAHTFCFGEAVEQ